MPTAIRVDNLSKEYSISHEGQERYTALRDVLAKRVKSIFRKEPAAPADREAFWALKDVSFNIQQGDRVGIIGRNGAGKSTLLKILSRITPQSSGRIAIKGRVASLLEVGTGFHPELTGRENIFLNGAILGMSRAEIRKKFDQIVDFAEVEKFLDTPVKRYSSGMYVRLAFAVAAHLEPEILIVDEVLAVGDAQFQKKCLGKMEDVSKNEGRTVLFVSHNIGAIANFCNQGLLLKKGRLVKRGLCKDVIAEYVTANDAEMQMVTRGTTVQTKPVITHVKVDQASLVNNRLSVAVYFESPFKFVPMAGVVVSSVTDIPIFGTNASIHPKGYHAYPVTEGCLVLEVKDLPLHSGTYKISVWLGDAVQNYDVKRDAAILDIVSPTFIPNTISLDVIGYTNVEGSWQLEEYENAR